MATHFKGPLLGARQLFGGAGEDLSIVAAQGESELVTVFDDFNDYVPLTDPALATSDTAVNHWEDCGWITAAIGAPAAAQIGMNDATVGFETRSSIFVNPGTAADTGLIAQYDPVTAAESIEGGLAAVDNIDLTTGGRRFTSYIMPPRSTSDIADMTKFIFACRVGLVTSVANAWNGKVFIGFAQANRANVLVSADGSMNTAAETPGPIGFHINGDPGSDTGIFGIMQRTGGTAYATGTNRVLIAPLTEITTNLLASNISWFDLAVRVVTSDVSANTGGTEFFYRKVGQFGPLSAPGPNGTIVVATTPWRSMGTLAAVPNLGAMMFPTIEAQNGPAATLVDCYIDWWAIGRSRARR